MPNNSEQLTCKGAQSQTGVFCCTEAAVCFFKKYNSPLTPPICEHASSSRSREITTRSSNFTPSPSDNRREQTWEWKITPSHFHPPLNHLLLHDKKYQVFCRIPAKVPRSYVQNLLKQLVYSCRQQISPKSFNVFLHRNCSFFFNIYFLQKYNSPPTPPICEHASSSRPFCPKSPGRLSPVSRENHLMMPPWQTFMMSPHRHSHPQLQPNTSR